MSARSRILHAALPADWARAQQLGGYDVSTIGRTLAEEGFIHASTVTQAGPVLDNFYADIPEVVVLVLDIDALAAAGSPVRWDAVPGAIAPFPHVYGVIPSSVVGEGNSVVAALPVSRRPGEPWSLPDLTPYDVLPEPPAAH